MKTIFGLSTFSIVSAWLLVWILVLGFQTRSLVDLVTLGGRFGPFESGFDLFLTFAIPAVLVFAFFVMAFNIIIKKTHE
jgi:hypothetical protein